MHPGVVGHDVGWIVTAVYSQYIASIIGWYQNVLWFVRTYVDINSTLNVVTASKVFIMYLVCPSIINSRIKPRDMAAVTCPVLEVSIHERSI